MKILHVAAKETYNDYWGYQINLLPHYHKILGHDVTVIVSTRTYKDGKLAESEESDYVLNDGVRVIKLKKRDYRHKAITESLSKLDIYKLICEIRPDFVFSHGATTDTIYDVVKYKKRINKDCIIVQDNHADFFNTSYNPAKLTHRLISLYGKNCVLRTKKYVSKYYGVTPCRCDYLRDHCGAPEDKIELLVMGGDDEKINFDNKDIIRKQIREQHNIGDGDFLIITGGKIDSKKNIHLLMEAVTKLENKNVKLIAFGNVMNDIKDEIERFADQENIRIIGWIEADKAYDYFLAGDLAVFPGLHSVLWEQACACGIPAVFSELEGMRHVDVGGNCLFLKTSSADEIYNVLKCIINDKEKYLKMKKVAIEKGLKEFSYLEISKKALMI